MKKISYIVLMAVMVLMVCGCRRQPGSAVMQLYELTDTAPAQALAGLDSLTTANLSETDRRMADFVRLKASDKVYITHTSDSTILALLDYYEDDDRFGPEVLYYAGRVYSDLGDYPTALTYFQKALQATPTEKNLRLRSAIASQTGRLLNTLKLHNQAIPYLKETLHLDSLRADTVNLLYDHQLLGAIYMRAGKIDSAEIAFNVGRDYANNLSDEDKSQIDLYLADIAFIKGENKKALDIIRGVPEKIKPKFRNLSLLYATKIYLANGITDTAYRYADELIHSNYLKNKRGGYDFLLNSDLKQFIPRDSIVIYLSGFNKTIIAYSKTLDAENVIQQNTKYNYETHELKRISAENKLKTMIIWTLLVIMVVFALFTLLLYSRYRNKKNLILLKKAVEEISILQKKVSENNSQKTEIDNKIDYASWNVNDLLAQLKDIVAALNKTDSSDEKINIFENCEPYIRLKELLEAGKAITNNTNPWADLSGMISNAYPDFFKTVESLFNDQLSEIEVQTIMLIKCNFTVTEMAQLLSLSKSSISNRRKRICRKIPGDVLSSEQLDIIIHSI